MVSIASTVNGLARASVRDATPRLLQPPLLVMHYTHIINFDPYPFAFDKAQQVFQPQDLRYLIPE